MKSCCLPALPLSLLLSLPLFTLAGEVDAHADGTAPSAQACGPKEGKACPSEQRKPPSRRAVPDQRPLYVPPVTPPPPSVRVVPPVILPGPVVPSAPAPLGSCDGAGCWNSEGGRYNGGGSGDTYLNNGGRLCNRNGAWVQCF